MFLCISKHICMLLIKYVFSKDVKRWLMKAEMAEMESNNKQHYPNSDNRLISYNYQLSDAKVSSPGKLSHLLPSNQKEIKLFSFLMDTYGLVSSEFDIKRLQEVFIEGLFYCVSNKRIPHSKLLYDAFRKHECHVWHYCVHLLPIFLLLDSPKEAYGLLAQPVRSHNVLLAIIHWAVLNSVLKNGRRKKVEYWDFKVLAAYIKTYKFFFFSLSVYQSFDIQQEQSFTEDSQDESVVNDFNEICLKMKGRESEYLSTFRCQIIDVMGKYSLFEALEILKQMHVRFYNSPISRKLENNIVKGNSNPLALILKFINDGHIKESMDLDDIKDLFKLNTKIKSNLKHQQPKLFESGVVVKRGECLIINQIFKDDPQFYREGTEQDENYLIQTWKTIGCKDAITVARDLTKTQIISTLNQFRRKLEQSRPDFMVVIIMSHGFRDKRTGCDCIMDINKEGLSVTSIKNKFIDGHMCGSMIGKPKFFFIQACRGKLYQDPLSNFSRNIIVPVVDFSETDGEEDAEKMLELDGIMYAHKSWFFIFHSTIKGYVSLRDRYGGTIFIQTLCKALNESWYVDDISTIAMQVNKRIMNDYGHAQAPIFENQLGNLVYFDAINAKK